MKTIKVKLFLVFLVAAVMLMSACGGGGGEAMSSGSGLNGSGGSSTSIVPVVPPIYNGYFSGQVVMADGKGAPYINIEFRDEEGYYFGRFGTDENGYFKDKVQILKPINGGTITAYYFDLPQMSLGLAPSNIAFSISPEGTLPPIKITVIKGPAIGRVAISGRLTDSVQFPLARQAVNIMGISRSDNGLTFPNQMFGSSVTDADGRFTVDFPLAAKTQCWLNYQVDLTLEPGKPPYELGTLVVRRQ